MSDINRKLGPNNESYRSLVAILANKRIQKGLSQYELAKRAGVAHTTIARIEALEYVPLLPTFLSIAYALGCTVTIQDKEGNVVKTDE